MKREEMRRGSNEFIDNATGEELEQLREMFLLLCNQKVKELETTGEIKNKLLKDIIRKEQADWSIEDFVKAGEEYALSEHRRRLQIEIEQLKRGKESVESLGELFRRLARAS